MLKKIVKTLPAINYINAVYYPRMLRRYGPDQEPDLTVAKKFSSGVVLDLGAAVGVYSIYLSKFAKEIFAVEPIPSTFSILCLNIAHLGLKNITPSCFAVSDCSGECYMTITDTLYRCHISDRGTVCVPTITVDARFGHLENEITLVKMDLEGHESRALKGASRLMANGNAAWLIENPEKDAVSLFKDCGYTSEKISAANTLFYR